MILQIITILIDILIALTAGLAAFRRSRIAGATSLGILSLSVAIWVACYLLIENPAVRSLKLYWIAIIYFAAIIAASAQLTFALSRTNRRRWINVISLNLLGIMPVLTQVLYWIGPWHGLLFGAAETQTGNFLFVSSLWAKISAFYIYSITGAGVVMLWDAFFRKRTPLFTRFLVILLGSLFPILAEVLDFAGFSPIRGMELLPFGFTLAALAFSTDFLNQASTPVVFFDRNAVVEGMDDGWMVLDNQNKIVDMNSAAESMTGLSRDKVYGQTITSVFSDQPNLGQIFNGGQELEVRRSLRFEEGWRYLNIRISSLTDRYRKPFGRLALWRDTTERKLTEDARQRARDEMFVLLNAISSAASNTLDLDAFLLESMYHIIYPFRSQVICIFLVDDKARKDEPQRLFLASHLGLSAKSINELAYVFTASPPFDWVIENRQPFQIEEAGDDPHVPSPIRNIGIACLLTIPLIAQTSEEGKVIGCMCMARKEKPAFSQDEIARLTTISDQIANLIDSDRRRKVAIVSSERQRLMRDLHDSVSQKLYGLVTMTEAAQAALEAGSPIDPSEIMPRIGENARQAVKEMRLFLYQMQPVDVENDGLISLLHHRLAAVEGRADIKARLLADLADEEIALSKDKEVVLYYVAQEALNNILRHAHAKSITVTLKQGRRNVILEIVDDGCGFEPKKVERGGLGLLSMRERISQIKGILKITSKPDKGTRIVITVPREPANKLGKQRR
jgi:PAS domain S-box-containing protein